MKSRLISMSLTGLALALVLLIAVQITQTLRRNNVDGTPLFASGQSGGQSGGQAGEQVGGEGDLSRTLSPAVLQAASETSGRLHLSGHAEPEAIISILNKEQPVRQFKSDDNGQWETSLEVDTAQPMIIDFLAMTEDGNKVHSDQTLYRVPPPQVDEASMTPQALIMAAAAGGPSRVFQSPFRGLPVSGPLSMGAIDYDGRGGVIFHGQSERDGRVRIYANETAIGETHVQDNGDWYMMASNTLPKGRYDIRAELLGPEGTNLANISVSFERLVSSDPVPASSVKVYYRPYSWQVQRGLYGGGQQFTAIYAPPEASPIIQK